MLLSTIFLALLALVAALPQGHDHDHVVSGSLPGTWYQSANHPVHALFKRAPGDGVNYPAVGSSEWRTAYPRGELNPNNYPRAWVDALNRAVAQNRIPNLPQTNQTAPMTNPYYPPGLNPNSPEVCSSTYKCRNDEDIWDAPPGVFASSFDDGPLPTSERLVTFLTSQNVQSTHFMIGVNILDYPQQFLQTFDSGGDLAVHTYTHPYMTMLDNLGVVGQLGWTMQLIHDSSGGRVPKYWRPPYGDSDNRVRAIAKEVFGLETVIWNQDTLDWQDPTPVIQGRLHGWITGPKSPGLVILEHENSFTTVDAFIGAFPQIAANGWDFQSLAQVYGDKRAYQNAQDSTSDDVQRADVVYSATPSTSTSSLIPPQTQASVAPSSTSNPVSDKQTGFATTSISFTNLNTLVLVFVISVVLFTS